MSSLSSLSSLNLTSAAPALAVNGLVSGLDTNKIVQGLLAIDQSRIDFLQRKQTKVQQVQAAFKGIEARLLAVQGQITQLSRTQNGVFDARSVSTSDDSLVTAAASSSAVAGVYSIKVGSLATAHQLASQGFDGSGSAITQGTVQVKIGDGTAATITIDATNATLQGLADAINGTGLGVSATVINDGSGAGAQPYRLLLTAKGAGTSNRITITNGLTASAGGAVKPLFDQNAIGSVATGAGSAGTTTVSANTGAGGYTGTTNNSYQFTVLTGGTVGTDSNLQVAFTDRTGSHTGILTLNASDVDTLKDVAEGVKVQFSAGTLLAGQSFSLKTYVPEVQAATDASVTIGSGNGALTVTSSTNQVDALIPGVTLNLQGADPAKSVTITVASDTVQAKKAIHDFVGAFNDLMKYIDDQVHFDAQSGSAGLLLGDRSALTVQDQLRSVMTGVVDGANPRMNRLGALGITIDNKGQLVIDDAKLAEAVEGRKAGVTLGDVRKLFALAGTSSNPGVQFVTGSVKTQASGQPVQVQISQAAQSALLTATSALADSTVLNNTNNQLTLTLDGATSSQLALPEGTYTRQGLVAAMQAAVNAETAFVGRKLTVGLANNQLTLTSASFGTTSNVAIGAGSANALLGLAGTETASGQDVVGHFVVNGLTESAVGRGQFLAGNVGNAATADLQVRVTLTAAQIGAGLSTNMTVTRGIASRVDIALNSLLDPVTGRMKALDTGFQQTLDQFDADKIRQNALMESHRTSLLQQFAAMERTLSQLQAASGFLNSQALTLPKQSSSG